MEFYSKKLKTEKSVFESPFGGLKGNVCIKSIACWKARRQFPIRHNWIFFAISYSWDVSGNLSK